MDISRQELLDRHKTEKKELQGKITKLKQSFTKTDKKKKKEVNKEVEKLESELHKRHKEELAKWDLDNGKVEVDETTQKLISMMINEKEKKAMCLTEDTDADPEADFPIVHKTKAQKRRERKEQEEQEREQRLAEGELEDSKHIRREEITLMENLLITKKLKVHEIDSDGDCMFKAIIHQLSLQNVTKTVRQLRKLAADTIRANIEDFAPFLAADYDEDVENSGYEDVEKYCKEIESTKKWGGNIELRAISQGLKVEIEVIQAYGSSVHFEVKNANHCKILLSYHRHAYRLGEHYNSLVPM